MKALMYTILILLFSFNLVHAQESDDTSTDDTSTDESITSVEGTQTLTYGVKYNFTTERNEIWKANDDGTEEFLTDFRFPTNSWTPSLSFADTTTGKLFL